MATSSALFMFVDVVGDNDEDNDDNDDDIVVLRR